MWKSPTLTASGSPNARMPDLGRRPRADAREGEQRPVRGRRGPRACRGGAAPSRSSLAASRLDGPDELRPAALQARAGGTRSRGAPRAPPARAAAAAPNPPGCRLAVPRHDRPVGPPRLVAGDLLLEDRRHQRLVHRARPPDAAARGARRTASGDGGVARDQGRRVVVQADQPAEPLQRPGRCPGPTPARGRTGLRLDEQRHRALGRPRRPPGRAGDLEPHRGVAAARAGGCRASGAGRGPRRARSAARRRGAGRAGVRHARRHPARPSVVPARHAGQPTVRGHHASQIARSDRVHASVPPGGRA